jgi:hypothetical protein
MRTTFDSRFGGGAAHWLAVPAVLGLVGAAVVSLAIGAAAVGGPRPAVSNICAAAVHTTPCRGAAIDVTAKAAPMKSVGTLPTAFRQPMTTSPISADDRARAAAIRAQLRVAMPTLASMSGK